MRHFLPQPRPRHRATGFCHGKSFFLFLFAAVLLAPGCVGGGASSGSTPPPAPPSSVTVTISPGNGVVVLGNQLSFSATVTGSSNTLVAWSVNGIAGGNAASGTISVNGLYTAPADFPAGGSVQVTATSQADATRSASAQITVTSDIVVAITPGSASVNLGAVQSLHASLSSSGHPDTAMKWMLSGAACPSACGSLDASGNYTAPAILPSSPSVTVTAQSVADATRQASAEITLVSSFTLTLSAPSSVPTSTNATLVATITPATGSSPSLAVNWSLSGSGCSGSACGTLSSVTTQSANNVGPSTVTATYTAPPSAPSPDTVTVVATPVADPSKHVSATIAIQGSGSAISITPPAATLAANHRITLTAQLSGVSAPNLTWSVNGISGGSAGAGEICVAGSNPCQQVATTTAAQVDFVAPGAIPSPNPVTVQVASATDATRSATAQITILNHVLVSVLPGSVTLAPSAAQLFTATVLGATNPQVTWQLQGAACGASGACGALDTLGNYTAPGAAPSPDAIQVVAISVDDPTQSGSAAVTISTGVNIQRLHPASVYAAGANGFTLLLSGTGFAASSPGPGSVAIVGGAQRAANCTSATQCTVAISPADVASPQSLRIAIQNPGGKSSNSVALIVVAPNSGDATITLSSTSPESDGNDITVVEPTTAGVSATGNDVDLNVAALGAFSAANNSCALGGNPVVITRPSSGSATADVCLFSESGLDASMTFTVSGPNDVSVVAKQPAGLGILHLTLQIPANAQAGARTLFIQTTNLDKTAATGALEIQ